MCGIAGSYLLHSDGANSDHQATMNAMTHRGPDNQSIRQFDKLNLIHTRLAILDTSIQSNQPMSDESSRYHLSFNGEIYNFRSIRQDLQNTGISFNTSGDTEVVLKQLIVKGIEGLKEFNGFFSLAFYDEQEDHLIVARDRFGIKPLLYSLDNNQLAFASELKALDTLIPKNELNHTALFFYFNLNYIPGPLSIHNNVKKLLSGHFISVKNNKVNIACYYDNTSPRPISSMNFSDAKTKLRTLLEQAIHDRMVSDVPLGTFLSGGLDSSIVTTIAAQQRSNIDSFSLGFSSNKYFDETKHAELVAANAKTNHHTILLEEDDLLNSLDDFLHAIDEPFADSSSIAYYLLCKHTKKELTVALSGDGADEIFAGYNKYRALLEASSNRSRNKLVKQAAPILKLFPGSRNSSWGNKTRQITKYADGLNKSEYDRYWSWCAFTDESVVDKLLIKSRKNSEISELKSNFLKRKDSYSINELLLSDQSLVLCNDMLYKADKMSMANSLEVRVPFLDHRVVEFARTLPSEYKIDANGGKRILREAFANVLPSSIIDRPKKGFEVPLTDWFNGPLNTRLLDFLNPSLILDQGIFNSNEVDLLRSKIKNKDTADIVHLLWALFVFQNFWKKNN